MKLKTWVIIVIVGVVAYLVGASGKYQSTNRQQIVVTPTPAQTTYPSEHNSTSTCLNLTQDGAMQAVKGLPQVKDFLQKMQVAGQPVLITPDSSKTDANGILIWIIHVAENHTDHLATFNWYYVNSCTGNITDFNGANYPNPE